MAIQRIQRAFQNTPIFVAGMVPGYPDFQTSFEAYKTLIDSGADMLEFSASFSDPIADGPTLQRAHAEVIKAGLTQKQLLEFYARLREYNSTVSFFLIEYANVVYQTGIMAYYERIKKAGIDALMIPDLSREDADPYVASAQQNGIAQVFAIAPTTPNERIPEISKQAGGFLYLVTITGITGVRTRFEQESLDFITRVKQHTNLPCIAGFGISKPEHAEVFTKAGANGVVSCSHIVNIVAEHSANLPHMQKFLKDYVVSMKKTVLPV
jgi:tryptophan synthase alpha chain